MVFVAGKPIDVVLLWEKNIIPWLISSSEHGVKKLDTFPFLLASFLSIRSEPAVNDFDAELHGRVAMVVPASFACATSYRRAVEFHACAIEPTSPTTNAPTSKRGEELCVTVLCRLVARVLTTPVSSMRWCRAPQWGVSTHPNTKVTLRCNRMVQVYVQVFQLFSDECFKLFI
jgi:hypothetical protein